MKAVVSTVYGDADVLHLAVVEQPAAVGADDVLVRVRAAGLDRGVWHTMTGTPYAIRLASGLRRQRVPVRGRDLAGVVAAVGARVTRLRPGDDVYGTTGTGSWTEFVVVPQSRLTTKPTNVSFEQAAATPNSGGTALQAVRDKAEVKAGQRVLVTGAAGGVGSFAVQIAKSLGATVTGVCSTANVEFVRSLGAGDLIDYTREEVDRDGACYDAVIDIAGNRPLPLLRRALAPGGIVVLVGGEGGGKLLGMDRQLRVPFMSRANGQRFRNVIAFERLSDLEDLRALIESGTVTPAVDRVFPLAEAADAMRHLVDGHPRGKVVISV